MKFGLAPTTIMIFMFVLSVGVRSRAFNLPESLLELQHALDLPPDFLKPRPRPSGSSATKIPGPILKLKKQRLQGPGNFFAMEGLSHRGHRRAFWNDFTF